MEKPMPRLPPVTRATLSERSIFMFRVPTSAFRVSLRRLQEALDLIGASQGHDVGSRHRPLQQPRQHVAWPDLQEARATASGSPEMTVWSGAFRFAATATAPPTDDSRQAASTSAVASPSTAAMVPGRSLPA